MTPPKSFHLQRSVVLGGETVKVDLGIARLVEALWAAGYRTVSSCEDMPTAYGGEKLQFPIRMVAFATKAEALRFARLLSNHQLVEPTDEAYAGDAHDLPRGAVGVTFIDLDEAMRNLEREAKRR